MSKQYAVKCFWNSSVQKVLHMMFFFFLHGSMCLIPMKCKAVFSLEKYKVPCYFY